MKVEFNIEGDHLVRRVECGCYSHETHQKALLSVGSDTPISTHWAKNEFMLRDNFAFDEHKKPVTVVDIFCGSGGLSLGVRRALETLNLRSKFLLACDAEKASLDIYKANFRPKNVVQENVKNLISGPASGYVGQRFVDEHDLDERLSHLEGGVDIFIAGPPCEGNSNLNNKTRRSDLRNELYVTAGLIGAKLRAKIIILENVPTVLRANQDVVRRTQELLASSGYRVFVDSMIFASKDFLVGQTRRRHFLVAIKGAKETTHFPLEKLLFPELTAWDVIGDLENKTSTNDLMLMPSDISEENVQRIKYLFDNDEFDLPDFERPDCHKLKAHNYKSVYGRMHADKPSPTITTGFQSPGRGRFIHPTARRGLTPREGARIQGFPDSFRWNGIGLNVTKQNVTRLIGDAVPPNLGMFVVLSAIDLMPDGF